MRALASVNRGSIPRQSPKIPIQPNERSNVMATQWKMIGRGMAGWHARGTDDGNQVSSSGGTLQDYLDESQDGVMIYDAEDADMSAFIDWTYKGPMAKVELAPGEVHRWLEEPAIETSLNAQGEYEQTELARFLQEGSYRLGAFDYVALDIYKELFKLKVPGVRFGKVVNHAIEWDS